MNITDLPPELFLQCCTAHHLIYSSNDCVQKRHLDRIATHRQSFLSPMISYLGFKDWVELDKALTNHKLRKEYLGMICGLEILHPAKSEIKDHLLFLMWAKSRMIVLKGIIIAPETIEFLRSLRESSLLCKICEILIPTPSKELFTPMISLLTRMSTNNVVLNFDGNDRITVPGLKKVLKVSPSLQSLSVRGCRYINTQILHHIPVYVPNLTALYMSKCRLLAEDIISTVRALPHLTILDVSSCISYHTASILLDVRPTLEEFYINNLLGAFQHSHPEVVRTQLTTLKRSLEDNGRSLKVFAIQESTLLTDSFLISWILGSRHSFCMLESLNVSACRNITDALLEILAQRCPVLQALDVRDCGHLTDQGVSLIGLQCQRICDVALDGCFQITNESIVTFYRENPARRVKISFKQCFRIVQQLLNASLLNISNT